MTITVVCAGVPKLGLARFNVDAAPGSELSLGALLLTRLPAQGYAAIAEAVCRDGELAPGFAILVNGRNASQIGGMDTIVEDGATVLITAQVVGG